MNFCKLGASTLALLLVAISTAKAEDAKKDLGPDELVHAALQAEVDGDTEQRDLLLSTAMQVDPDHASARWQSGHVRYDDTWLAIEDAEKETARQGLVAQYRQLRNRAVGHLAGELALGRRCRKQKLTELEQRHWTRALQIDPSNKEARGRLGVREFRGRLMIGEQIVAWKQSMKVHQEDLDKWTKQLSRWQREIEESSTPALSVAWLEMSKLDAPSAVAALEKMAMKSEPVFQQAIITILGNIQEQTATDALTRLALFANGDAVRYHAAKTLGERSRFGYVPSLLSYLETPIEYRYAYSPSGVSMASQLVFSQETPSALISTVQTDRVSAPLRFNSSDLRTHIRLVAWHERRIKTLRNSQLRRLQNSVQAVEQKNAQTMRFNERVYETLETSTGLQLESQPKYWWKWWNEYNEYEDSEEKPQIRLTRSSHVYRTTKSCFAAGTPVWTDTGAMAIEKVQPGDRVLSQDPMSGELSYQIVADATVRPPSETLRMKLADEEIVATLGHPIWKVGTGWQMAKKLKPGDQVHCPNGSVTIENIEPGEEAEAYNLVVENTNTYFVGKQRILVHDNMPRRVVEVPLPGWVVQ